jgi:nicotinamidase-related amidase
VAILNDWIGEAVRQDIPVFASRDWHPRNHISFTDRGGPWPRHCVQRTQGAEFHPDLQLPANVYVIDKGNEADKEAYSAFERTNLAELLKVARIRTLWVAGLALDYCVKASALDAVRLGFEVHLIADATRAVNVLPGDGESAIREMQQSGVIVEKAA